MYYTRESVVERVDLMEKVQARYFTRLYDSMMTGIDARGGPWHNRVEEYSRENNGRRVQGREE